MPSRAAAGGRSLHRLGIPSGRQGSNIVPQGHFGGSQKTPASYQRSANPKITPLGDAVRPQRHVSGLIHILPLLIAMAIAQHSHDGHLEAGGNSSTKYRAKIAKPWASWVNNISRASDIVHVGSRNSPDNSSYCQDLTDHSNVRYSFSTRCCNNQDCALARLLDKRRHSGEAADQ